MLIAVVAAGARRPGRFGLAGRDHRHALRRHSAIAAGAAPAGVLARPRCRRCCRTRSPSRCWARSNRLLSAVVADGMTGRRHRSNCELVAQGVANIGSALFGGICVTGTIARTATNVRAGARGPIAGMLHALFLLLFMLLAAPLAALHPAGRAGRRAGDRGLEHGGEARVRHAAAQLARRCRGAAGDLPADRVPRPDRRHRRRLRHRRGAVHPSHGQATGIEAHAPLVPPDRADDAEARARPTIRGWPPTATSSSIGCPAPSSSARHRPSAPCSTASATDRKAFMHRLLGRAVRRFDRGQRHRRPWAARRRGMVSGCSSQARHVPPAAPCRSPAPAAAGDLSRHAR